MIQENQKRPGIFFGWWITGAGFMNSLLILGMVNMGFTAFFEPLIDTFGWSYAQISLAASIQAAEAGVLAPVAGLLVDRLGPKRLMFFGVLLLGLSLLFLSRINSLGTFYFGFIVVALGLSGASPTTMGTTLAHWFRKRLGIAMGIVSCGFAFAGLLVPVVVMLIDNFDWRTAFFVMGVATLVIGLPLSLLFRHRPEQYGYLPDGERSPAISPEHPAAEAADITIGTKQALRSRTFWHLGIAALFQSLAISVSLTHIMPYLSSIGVARSTAGLVAMAIPLVSISGRLGSGWLGDRYNKRMVAAGLFTSTFLGLICTSLAAGGSTWLIVPYIILFGIGWGANSTLRLTMMREYFGRGNFGTIYGISMGMTAMGMIIGPLFAGWIFDTWGSYMIAWVTLTILVAAGAIIIGTTPPVSYGASPAGK